MGVELGCSSRVRARCFIRPTHANTDEHVVVQASVKARLRLQRNDIDDIASKEGFQEADTSIADWSRHVSRSGIIMLCSGGISDDCS